MNLSIVIPSYNGRNLLEKNLPAVLAAAERFQGQAEIIVVDDGSSDGTVDWLEIDYPQVKLVSNRRVLRFAAAVNRGFEVADGEIVVLLNNDVSPRKDFLLNVLKHFNDETVGGVGCREINLAAGKKIYGGRGVWRWRRGLVEHWRPTDQKSRRADWVSGGSSAWRMRAWKQLGGFDRLFRPAYEEDQDLCWRLAKAGWRLIFEPKAIVEHFHETTNLKEFGQKPIEIYSWKNQLLLVWKNLSSARMLVSHLLWLPYHLVVTSLRTKGVFLAGFFLALVQLPEAIISRNNNKKDWRVSDEKIFSSTEK